MTDGSMLYARGVSMCQGAPHVAHTPQCMVIGPGAFMRFCHCQCGMEFCMRLFCFTLQHI